MSDRKGIAANTGESSPKWPAVLLWLVIPSLCFLAFLAILFVTVFKSKWGGFVVFMLLFLPPLALPCSVWGLALAIRNFRPKPTAIALLLTHILGVIVLGLWVLVTIALFGMQGLGH